MLTDESIVEWASGWVLDSPPGQRARFAEALREELLRRTHQEHCPAGKGERAACECGP
jgi:hypothetical protein